MRSEGNTATFGDVTIHLAKAYGFCWGVERAVQMAYEARARYPDSKLYITNEIIHNPGVNTVRSCFAAVTVPTVPSGAWQHILSMILRFLEAHRVLLTCLWWHMQRLDEMDVTIIEVKDGVKDFSPVQEGNVVILPAFGASVEEMRMLADRGVQIVDTTCPWVAKACSHMSRCLMHGLFPVVDAASCMGFPTVDACSYYRLHSVSLYETCNDFTLADDFRCIEQVADNTGAWLAGLACCGQTGI
jgi:4-hydroxy-3-methylbut-2-en-1-yl diphosphate reductase